MSDFPTTLIIPIRKLDQYKHDEPHPFWPFREYPWSCQVCGKSAEPGNLAPSGEPLHETGALGWPLTVRQRSWDGGRAAPGWQPEAMLYCPECGSLRVISTTEQHWPGTGPGRTPRFGDPYSPKLECESCSHSAVGEVVYPGSWSDYARRVQRD